MLTTRAGISGHENLLPEIRLHAEAIPAYFRRHRRLLRFVDTRQKWLLLHLAAITCASEGPVQGAAANWIAERATALGIACRNTSLAFFNQLAAYGYLERKNYRGDRRIKLISLTDPAEAALADWTLVLLETTMDREAGDLDRRTLMRIHAETMATLFANSKWMQAPLDIRLTQYMRGGWLVMSEILRHLPQSATGEAWIPAPGLSIPAMTDMFGLSRSTLYRLVRSAVDAGIMQWEERRSVSTLMLNLYHVRQYSRFIGQMLAAARLAHDAVVDHSPAAADADLSIPRSNMLLDTMHCVGAIAAI